MSASALIRCLLPDRGRALVVAVLVVLAAPWVVGVPSAEATALGTVGPGGGPTAVGEDSTDPVGVWPLRPVPEVVRRFDPPTSTWGAGHRGVDLLGHVGDPVYAALPGVVTYAGVLAGRGVVVVDHGATRTTYEPVTAVVKVGSHVAAGDRIGTLEAVQSHCAPRACLHWGWIADPDVYLDPLRLVGGPQPVRLLPLWQDAPATDPTVGRRWSPASTPVVAPWGAATAQARGCAC